MAPEATPKPTPGSAGYLESLDKRRHAKAMGLTVLVGRNTMKEYFWGFKQGWLVDFDAVQEERGDEGKLQDLREELDKDGVFDVPLQGAGQADDPLDASEPQQPSTSLPHNAPSSLFAPRSSYSFLSQKHSVPETMPEIPETRSLIVPAATEIPAQPPVLILPFDHPLGYLRHWPVKMVKYLFCERYRVRQGCEAALAIINATQPDDSLSHLNTLDNGESRRGLRPLQAPRRLEDVMQHEEIATIDDVVTENKKKVRGEWLGDDLPESGSKDLDTDYYSEYHYRKSFSETPANIISGKKVFYEELPAKLQVARELENRDRLPTKEEQKYPPPTEDTLRKERLNKEKKWRNDFQGWLVTRVGSKVTWDPRFETFKVLDLDLAKEAIRKHGLAGERSNAVNSEFM
jgi:import inner membrane translocase subunit TIM54